MKAAEEKLAAKTVGVKRSEQDMFVDMTNTDPIREKDDSQSHKQVGVQA